MIAEATTPVVGVLLAAYALGCLNAGYYLVRLRTGGDVRDSGSGAAGATNTGRVLGSPGFVLTLLLDGLKAAVAVGAAQQLQFAAPWCLATLGAVVAGHIWPVQLGFRGGKGVGPFLGGLLAYDLRLLLIFGLLFGALWVPWRRFALAGLTALTLLPPAAWWLGSSPESMAVLVLVCSMILVAHRRNIRNEIAQRPSGNAPAHPPDPGESASATHHEHGTPDRV